MHLAQICCVSNFTIQIHIFWKKKRKKKRKVDCSVPNRWSSPLQVSMRQNTPSSIKRMLHFCLTTYKAFQRLTYCIFQIRTCWNLLWKWGPHLRITNVFLNTPLPWLHWHSRQPESKDKGGLTFLILLCSFTGGHLILQRRKYCNYWWVKGQGSNCAFWKPQSLLICYTWGFFPLPFPVVLSEQSLQRLLFSLYHKHNFLLPSGHHQSKERYTSVLLSGTQMFGICTLIPLNSFNVR